MKKRVLFVLLAKAFHAALSHNVLNIAKGAAFSAALSVFPGLIFFAALLFGGDAVETLEEISLAMGQVLPPRVHGLLATFLTVPAERSTGLLIGTGVVSVLFGADLMISLIEGFHAAYGLPRTWSVWKERAIGIGLVFLAMLPVALASGLMVFGRQIEGWLLLKFGSPPLLLASFLLVRSAIVLLTLTLVLAILYHVAPNRKQKWRDVFPGAIVASLLWLVSLQLFTFYLQRVARFSDLYGSVATVVVLLIWLYMVSTIVMIGCEFNVERERWLQATPQEAAPAKEAAVISADVP